MILGELATTLTQTAEAGTSLSAAVQLFAALNKSGIRYCHWKSNLRLEQSLAGLTDLDLLVDPKHEQAFRDTLAAHGFKPLADAPGKRYPGLEHHLGFDWQTGRLIHLHVHFMLVLGEQHVKNYHLPLEINYLDSARLRRGVKVPAPELELIVLSLRALLKYRDRDGIKDLLSIRSGGIPAYILDELRWLMGEISPAALERVMLGTADIVPVAAVRNFLQIISERPRSGRDLLRLRAEVRRGLRRYQRRSRLAASADYFKALWRKFRHGAQQMGLPCRGRTIALVGVDGSGKTTLSHGLAAWLSWKVDTHLLYLGSKQPSFRSKAFYWLFRAARRTETEITRLFSGHHSLAQLSGELKHWFLAQHYLSIAQDRYRRYLQANSLVARGSVVIFDRYPFEAPLDGPEIAKFAGKSSARLMKAAQREAGLYKRFQALDRLILLEVPVDVSIQRKPDHPIETIRAKNAALLALKQKLRRIEPAWKWDSVDASRTKEEVLLAAKRVVWEAL